MLTKTAASGHTRDSVLPLFLRSCFDQRGGIFAHPAARCSKEVLNNWPFTCKQGAGANMTQAFSLFGLHDYPVNNLCSNE
jgi:hypothetical protein